MTSIGKKDKERKVDWRKVKVQASYWLHCSIFLIGRVCFCIRRQSSLLLLG